MHSQRIGAPQGQSATHRRQCRRTSSPHLLLSSRACLFLFLSLLLHAAQAQLMTHFYQASCPQAENIIKAQVLNAVQQDIGNAARLLRLHFHDCFVMGCDGSVLLDAVDNVPAEKDASINFSLAAFDVVDTIKSALEAACPGIVSCADILAIAARDAVRAAGGPVIPMKTGRRDGFVSLSSATTSLPTFTNINGLITTFNDVGLNTVDMVTLSGAHTIGQGHCTSVSGRITEPDNLINPGYLNALRHTCTDSNGNIINLQPIVNDVITPNAFDNQYYKNLQNGLGTFITDSELNNDRRTAPYVQKYARNNTVFFYQFMKSMLAMSEISVLTQGEGEVRFDCHVTNEY